MGLTAAKTKKGKIVETKTNQQDEKEQKPE